MGNSKPDTDMEIDVLRLLEQHVSLTAWMRVRATCHAALSIVDESARMQHALADHPFVQGRIYQLLKDNYGPMQEGRHKMIDELLSQRFPSAQSRKAWAWGFQGSRKWRNNWDSFRHVRPTLAMLVMLRGATHVNAYYVGRCVQLLLDSNHKQHIDAMDLRDVEALIERAHDRWYCIYRPKRGTELAFRGCECGEYYVGDSTCACGDQRVSLEIAHRGDLLDATSDHFYAEED